MSVAMLQSSIRSQALASALLAAACAWHVPCHAEHTEGPEAWLTMPAEELDQAEAEAMQAVVRKYYELMVGGGTEAAFKLLAPRTQANLPRMHDPAHNQFIEIESVGRPEVVSASLVQVKARVTRRIVAPGANQGHVWANNDSAYFLRGDPQYLIHFRANDAPTHYSLPASPVRWFVPWWRFMKPEQIKPESHYDMLGLLSSQWPGWTEDEQVLRSRIQEWWQGQEERFGAHCAGGSVPWTPAGFTGMSNDSAVVERDIHYGRPPKDLTKVTYRFRLVREKTIYDAEKRRPFDWKIAEIRDVQVEAVALERDE